MAGRKRKPGVIRTRSGRASVAKEALQEHLPAVETRMRLWGLTEKDARDQKAETVIGRMCLQGQQLGGLSEPQYQALLEYSRQRDAAFRAREAVDSLRTASSRTMTPDELQHEAWAKNVLEKWDRTKLAIRDAQCEPSNRMHNLAAALDYVVIRNLRMGHLLDALRIAANALVRHYKLEKV